MKLDKYDNAFTPRLPRCWVVLDLESVVIDETGHKRYQRMERWSPTHDAQPSRRNYTRSEDPCQTPRWVFQTVVTASVMVLAEQPGGGVDVTAFETFSAPECTERQVIAGVLKVLADAPPQAELASWSGASHEAPILVLAACRHGLTLPARWRWLAYNGGDPHRHVDFARSVTGGLRMKPIHQAEVAAALDIPAKLTAPAFSVAKLIKAGRWAEIRDICEGDVITLAMIAARWRVLSDDRSDPFALEDRILRRVIELRPDRPYTAELQMRRDALFAARVARAANDATVLAPWLDAAAA